MFCNVQISTVEHRYNLEVSIHILEGDAQTFVVNDGALQSKMSGAHCSRVWADWIFYILLS